MSKPPKERVRWRSVIDGCIHKEGEQRRAVYTDAHGDRFVRVMGRKRPLDATNTYELHYTSVRRAL